MTLVRIADIADIDVSRLRADMRSRTADGELMHEHTAEEGPRMATLKTVTFRTIKLGPTLQRIYGGTHGQELYWNWTPDQPAICNYSGVLAMDEAHREYHILIEEVN